MVKIHYSANGYALNSLASRMLDMIGKLYHVSKIQYYFISEKHGIIPRFS